MLPPCGNIFTIAAAAAKSFQLCSTLCDPIDGSPPGSPIPGILQARTLEWLLFPSPVHESEKWKWSRSVVSDSWWPHGLQPTRLLRPWDFQARVLEWGAIAFSITIARKYNSEAKNVVSQADVVGIVVTPKRTLVSKCHRNINSHPWQIAGFSS